MANANDVGEEFLVQPHCTVCIHLQVVEILIAWGAQRWYAVPKPLANCSIRADVGDQPQSPYRRAAPFLDFLGAFTRSLFGTISVYRTPSLFVLADYFTITEGPWPCHSL